MRMDDRDQGRSLAFDETHWLGGRSTSGIGLRSLRTWLFASAFVVVAYFALFRLPFYFPPQQLLVSASYAFGFNNRVAVLAMAILIGSATFYRVVLSGSLASDPLLSFEEEGARKTRLSPWLFVAMVVVYTLLTTAMYAYTQGSATSMLTWESQHFLHRIKLAETYGLRPYVDIQAEYGPALMYPPIYLHRMLAPLGVSVQGAYFLCHLLMNVAGLGGLWYLLRHVAAAPRAKAIAFVVIGMAGFVPYMGLNGVVLRYVSPFAGVLMGHRSWVRLRQTARAIQYVQMILVVAVLAVMNVLLSPEIAVAFALGWLAYTVLWVRRDWRLLAMSLPTLAATAVGCYLLLPAAYYGSLLRFSQGANNLPMLPAPHLLLYIATLVLLVVPLQAAGWRNGQSDAPLLGSLGTLSVAMMPGALGRCDPPHVLFYGLVVSMLLMVRLASVSRTTFLAYVSAYVVVFIGMMQMVNLYVFFGIGPRQLSTHPARSARTFIQMYQAEFAPRDLSYLAALDKYPAIGLPLATYGIDNAAEEYLFAHRKIEPEFYVSVVGVYTKAEISRKLADTLRHEYLLVRKGWDQLSGERADQWYLATLQKWFLYPARLQWIRPDLDSDGELKRFIAEHYRAVEEVGQCVVVRRIDTPDLAAGNAWEIR